MFLHKNFLSPAQKIVFLFLCSLLSITTDNEYILGSFMGLCTILFICSEITSRNFRIWLIAVLLTFWGTLFSQSLFYNQMPRSILLQLIADTAPVIGPITGGVNIYKEGISYGLLQGLRFAITLTCGLYICFTTESKDILRAAVSFRIPVNVSFMLSIALKFIPLIVDESRTVLRAHKLRGFSFGNSVCLHPLRTSRSLLRPILVNAVRRSSMLSLSVESRHFNNARSIYCVPIKKGTPCLSFLLMITFLGVVSAAMIKTICFLYLGNYFYSPLLRPLYYIGDKWL